MPFVLLLATVSCKKSNSGSTGASLSGTWNFVGLVAQTSATVDQVYGGDDYKDVTVSNYTTTNNGGTITFNGGVATETNLTYEANFTALESTYFDGQLINSTSSPFDITIPATSGSTKYQQIGSDSLYFAAGGIFTMGPTAGTQTPSQGSTFTIHGDTLAMTTSIHQVVNQDFGGVPATETEDAFEIAYWTKK